MIILDGAYGEGGGQILRTALTFSLLTDQPFRIENIRLGRTQPGLKPQHLHILKALIKMCDAKVEGVQPGALTLTFYPGRLRAGIFHLDIGTAGAVPLVLQTLLPVAMFAGGRVTWSLRGGTDVPGAMTMDFWQYVLLPFLAPYARHVDIQVVRRGYYPAGGGSVIMTAVPRFTQTSWMNGESAPPLAIPERGAFRGLHLVSRASSQLQARRVAERQVGGFTAAWDHFPGSVQVRYEETLSPGSSVTAFAQYEHTWLGADALGERGKPAEEVGRIAAQRLHAELNAEGTVDVHTADNLMLWMALFGGGYRVASRTGHIETNLWVIEQFLPGALALEGGRLVGRAVQTRSLAN